MAYDENIINYAKGLYLQVNDNEKKVYSLRDISNILLKKFNIKVSYATISFWSKQGNWKNEFEILKNANKKKEVVSIDKQTEHLDNKFLSDLLKDYKNAQMLTNIGYDSVLKIYKKEKVNVSMQHALNAIKIGSEIKDRIRGLPELTEDKEKEDKPTVWKFGDNYIEF